MLFGCSFYDVPINRDDSAAHASQYSEMQADLNQGNGLSKLKNRATSQAVAREYLQKKSSYCKR